jgi:SAM-dependent methyltransferase
VSKKVNYGIDAPSVIRNLLIAGAALMLGTQITPPVPRISLVLLPWHQCFAWSGAACLVAGILMLIYGKWGKLHHRDRILGLYHWKGDEKVLDVGTGRGLLLAGAAKRLTSGHATGIDIWSKEDLSGNACDQTQANLEAEGVSELCMLLGENAQNMSFADASFDIVLSNLCLHNIHNKQGRRQACHEIARVLKPRGTVLISDYKRTREYAEELGRAGLEVKRQPTNWLTTFPPLAIVIAHKP